MSLAASDKQRLSNRCAYSRPFSKKQEFNESLCHWRLSRRRQSEQLWLLRKRFTKRILYTHSVIYLESKRKRHEAVDRALQVGIKSGQDRISGWLSVVCRRGSIKCPVFPTTLSIYNQHVWTESTVQLAPLWASRWHRVFVSARPCVWTGQRCRVCFGVCDIECVPNHGHWIYLYTSQGRWLH